LRTRPLATSTPFPYTTLFRSLERLLGGCLLRSTLPSSALGRRRNDRARIVIARQQADHGGGQIGSRRGSAGGVAGLEAVIGDGIGVDQASGTDHGPSDVADSLQILLHRPDVGVESSPDDSAP